MSSPDLADALRSARTIAVVGCSPRGFQTSHRIAQYIQRAGYQMVPVNPNHDEILGETAYPDLASIPDDVVVDIVDVFRRSEFTADVVRDASSRMERTGQTPLIWTQLGVHSAEAERLAAEAGLPYVANRCLMVDHAALV
ncbi:CoA-binding protein [Rubrivirga sp. S365]|uniref:CoA-binding protein n=1 Tax=Rubrivirga litoralis TaxID=3075598 RepID=A0ABU3BN33_9BACT|nr:MULTISPECIES: CoA-binding protein [unclassified Rubrivirga]MDT0630699.1 CoA-binding protein [Rubrivirga sp. F394]MDT7856271.1 CoA-binding protein [Rubrivirga sp. S365]